MSEDQAASRAGTKAKPSPRTDLPAVVPSTFTTYDDFGRRFFQTAVTRSRIEGATASLAGRPVQFGPQGLGPMGLVKVSATGAVGVPTVAGREDPEHVAFTLTIPIEVDLTIELGIDKNRFHAQVQVRLGLTARAAAPLYVVIDIAEPSSRDVSVELRAEGMRASALKVVAGVDRELKRAVVKVVRGELAKPSLAAARVIDVAKALERL